MLHPRYTQIAQTLAESHGVESGQMFGKPCLKAGGKAFAAFYRDCMVFKIGREEVAQLIKKYPGSENWDPSGKGRPMKDWLQVPADFEEDWMTLAMRALEFCS